MAKKSKNYKIIFHKYNLCFPFYLIKNLLLCSISARDPRAPFEIIRLYLEAGGKADKCIMSHLDRKWNCLNLNIETFAKISEQNFDKSLCLFHCFVVINTV